MFVGANGSAARGGADGFDIVVVTADLSGLQHSGGGEDELIFCCSSSYCVHFLLCLLAVCISALGLSCF